MPIYVFFRKHTPTHFQEWHDNNTFFRHVAAVANCVDSRLRCWDLDISVLKKMRGKTLQRTLKSKSSNLDHCILHCGWKEEGNFLNSQEYGDYAMAQKQSVRLIGRLPNTIISLQLELCLKHHASWTVDEKVHSVCLSDDKIKKIFASIPSHMLHLNISNNGFFKANEDEGQYSVKLLREILKFENLKKLRTLDLSGNGLETLDEKSLCTIFASLPENLSQFRCEGLNDEQYILFKSIKPKVTLIADKEKCIEFESLHAVMRTWDKKSPLRVSAKVVLEDLKQAYDENSFFLREGDVKKYAEKTKGLLLLLMDSTIPRPEKLLKIKAYISITNEVKGHPDIIGQILSGIVFLMGAVFAGCVIAAPPLAALLTSFILAVGCGYVGFTMFKDNSRKELSKSMYELGQVALSQPGFSEIEPFMPRTTRGM